MEKPYDVQVLLERLKEAGLDVTEEAARKLVSVSVAWFAESAVLSPTPIDDVFAALVPAFQKAVLAEVDKINGKVNG